MNKHSSAREFALSLFFKVKSGDEKELRAYVRAMAMIADPVLFKRRLSLDPSRFEPSRLAETLSNLDELKNIMNIECVSYGADFLCDDPMVAGEIIKKLETPLGQALEEKGLHLVRIERFGARQLEIEEQMKDDLRLEDSIDRLLLDAEKKGLLKHSELEDFQRRLSWEQQDQERDHRLEQLKKDYEEKRLRLSLQSELDHEQFVKENRLLRGWLLDRLEIENRLGSYRRQEQIKEARKEKEIAKIRGGGGFPWLGTLVGVLAVVFIGIIVWFVVIPALSGSGPKPVSTPSPPAITTPSPATTELWQPDREHVLQVDRKYLEQEGGFTIEIPPSDYKIIPVSVEEYEHLTGWGWNAEGKTENYIDSWLVNSEGNKISESGRAFNYSCGYTSPGLPEGTYYIYLSNEFTSASAKSVKLHVSWSSPSPTPVPSSTPTPIPAPIPSPALTPVKPAPEYHELSFELYVPEGEDYDEYSFPIYLRNDQALHFTWTVEQGDKIWFGFLTPDSKYFGVSSDGQFLEGSGINSKMGIAIFRPSEHGTGEGYYQMKPHLSFEGGQSQVTVQYWIESP